MPSAAWIARQALMRDYATCNSNKAGGGKKAGVQLMQLKMYTSRWICIHEKK